MADFDVLVIGGGPGGYAAALKAAELGARVAIIEAEKPGGACVNFACIPTNILVGSATAYLEAKELDVMGVFGVGERFNLGRATVRKDALVKKLADGIGAMLRMRKVTLIGGRARFASPATVEVALKEGGTSTISAEAFVIATGSRWEAPEVPSYPRDRVLLPDQVQSLTAAPASVLILADGPGEVPFGAEYAVLLAAAGAEVSIATAGESLFNGLDRDLHAMAEAGLDALGVRVETRTAVQGAEGTRVKLETADAVVELDAEAILAADPRRPFLEGLGPEVAGVRADGQIEVDRGCRTNVPHIFAVGDVTGGAMLTNVANHMGEVAGTNAAGGEALARSGAIPRMVHTLPEVGWVGLTEEAAKQQGHDVCIGAADLGFNAKAIAMGAREGAVKVVAERELGEVLGVHVVGPGTGELLAVASAAIQAEVPVQDLGAMVQWHPSMAESLAEAARRAAG
jgi:dihydrolipoamide dehydrogenase